jgi:hypothetical protein
MERLSVLVLVAACGGSGGSSADAPGKDAADDAGQCATTMCGATCCPSPAHVCSASGTACECPTDLIPQPFSTVIEMMDSTRIAPDVVGIGIVDGPDGNLHALVIGFNPTTTTVDVDHTLPIANGDPPFVALGYDINFIAQTTRSTYFVSQGTLRLTRRCPMGVAGSMAGIMLREQTSLDDVTPHPQGCSVSVPDLAFDFAGACN